MGQLGPRRGGDRLAPHQYGKVYATFLEPYVGKTGLICEIGILLGNGLAVWDTLFPNSKMIGLDINISNFQNNFINLQRKGAFKNIKINTEILDIEKFRLNIFQFDQLKNNKTFLKELLGDNKISIAMDDGLHTPTANLSALSNLTPFLAEDFVYFMEDLGKSGSENLAKSIETDYSNFSVKYCDRNIIVIKRK